MASVLRTPGRGTKTRAAAFTLAIGGLFGACAGPAEFTNRPLEPVAWPAPGRAPRIELLFAYGGSQDVKRRPGFFGALGEWLVGREPANFISPTGIALVGDVLWVVDTGSSCVHRVELTSGDHDVLLGTEAYPLVTPIGIAALPNGRVFVTDSTTGMITVFDPSGVPLRSFGGSDQLGRPTGICFDTDRARFLLLDTTGCRLLSLDAEGRILASTGKRGTALGQFNYPTNLALTSNGGVVVVDSLNFRVQVFSPELEPLRAFGQVGRGPGDFSNPKGIAVDSEDHVYVVDSMFDNVQIFDLDGRLLLTVSSQGSQLGELYLPTGIFIDGLDRLFIADSGNSRVQVMKFVGTGR